MLNEFSSCFLPYSHYSSSYVPTQNTEFTQLCKSDNHLAWQVNSGIYSHQASIITLDTGNTYHLFVTCAHFTLNVNNDNCQIQIKDKCYQVKNNVPVNIKIHGYTLSINLETITLKRINRQEQLIYYYVPQLANTCFTYGPINASISDPEHHIIYTRQTKSFCVSCIRNSIQMSSTIDNVNISCKIYNASKLPIINVSWNYHLKPHIQHEISCYFVKNQIKCLLEANSNNALYNAKYNVCYDAIEFYQLPLQATINYIENLLFNIRNNFYQIMKRDKPKINRMTFNDKNIIEVLYHNLTKSDDGLKNIVTKNTINEAIINYRENNKTTQTKNKNDDLFNYLSAKFANATRMVKTT